MGRRAKELKEGETKTDRCIIAAVVTPTMMAEIDEIAARMRKNRSQIVRDILSAHLGLQEVG